MIQRMRLRFSGSGNTHPTTLSGLDVITFDGRSEFLDNRTAMAYATYHKILFNERTVMYCVSLYACFNVCLYFNNWQVFRCLRTAMRVKTPPKKLAFRAGFELIPTPWERIF